MKKIVAIALAVLICGSVAVAVQDRGGKSKADKQKQMKIRKENKKARSELSVTKRKHRILASWLKTGKGPEIPSEIKEAIENLTKDKERLTSARETFENEVEKFAKVISKGEYQNSAFTKELNEKINKQRSKGGKRKDKKKTEKPGKSWWSSW